ncbi:hypothetical protein VP01_2188g1 [Puccinia sorghi]|uniref:Uncharacterized protein n=1 Tax=Puccinia sorghi TaxID=27349 RepID=A0A0L6V989_9BASI|nr:hypothetical protein VP01_2188g1 [Puccinia sorghi]
MSIQPPPLKTGFFFNFNKGFFVCRLLEFFTWNKPEKWTKEALWDLQNSLNFIWSWGLYKVNFSMTTPMKQDGIGQPTPNFDFCYVGSCLTKSWEFLNTSNIIISSFHSFSTEPFPKGTLPFCPFLVPSYPSHPVKVSTNKVEFVLNSTRNLVWWLGFCICKPSHPALGCDPHLSKKSPFRPATHLPWVFFEGATCRLLNTLLKFQLIYFCQLNLRQVYNLRKKKRNSPFYYMIKINLLAFPKRNIARNFQFHLIPDQTWLIQYNTLPKKFHRIDIQAGHPFPTINSPASYNLTRNQHLFLVVSITFHIFFTIISWWSIIIKLHLLVIFLCSFHHLLNSSTSMISFPSTINLFHILHFLVFNSVFAILSKPSYPETISSFAPLLIIDYVKNALKNGMKREVIDLGFQKQRQNVHIAFPLENKNGQKLFLRHQMRCGLDPNLGCTQPRRQVPLISLKSTQYIQGSLLNQDKFKRECVPIYPETMWPLLDLTDLFIYLFMDKMLSRGHLCSSANAKEFVGNNNGHYAMLFGPFSVPTTDNILSEVDFLSFSPFTNASRLAYDAIYFKDCMMSLHHQLWPQIFWFFSVVNLEFWTGFLSLRLMETKPLGDMGSLNTIEMHQLEDFSGLTLRKADCSLISARLKRTMFLFGEAEVSPLDKTEIETKVSVSGTVQSEQMKILNNNKKTILTGDERSEVKENKKEGHMRFFNRIMSHTIGLNVRLSLMQILVKLTIAVSWHWGVLIVDSSG